MDISSPFQSWGIFSSSLSSLDLPPKNDRILSYDFNIYSFIHSSIQSFICIQFRIGTNLVQQCSILSQIAVKMFESAEANASKLKPESTMKNVCA